MNNRQYQGAINRAQGKHFEQYIDLILAYYKERGLAMIEKTPEPMVPCQSLPNGRFVAYFQKKAQPDYKGTLRGGQSVVFEAKYTSSAKIEESRVSAEQARCLDAHLEMGAICFVLAAFGMTNIYRVPWAVWQTMKAVFGRKYVTPADLAIYKVDGSVNGLPELFAAEFRKKEML